MWEWLCLLKIHLYGFTLTQSYKNWILYNFFLDVCMTKFLVFFPFSRKKNRTTDAVRMLKRCTEIDATYVQAHLELFKLHHGIHAAIILNKAIGSNPENMELKLTLGYWLLDNGMQHNNNNKNTFLFLIYNLNTNYSSMIKKQKQKHQQQYN